MTPRPRVVVVAQASPAQGGIATFAETIVGDEELQRRFEVVLYNTTRRAVRKAGTFTLSNLWHAVQDSVGVFRAARQARIVHIQTALMPLLPLVRALALCAAARLGGARVLCHVHSGRVNSGRAEAFTPTRLVGFLIGRLTLAHRVLTCANAGTATLRALVSGVPVETVDNAVDVATFSARNRDAAPVRVLYVGTLSRRKGLGDLSEALPALRDELGDRWTLEIVGGAAEVGEAEAEELRQAVRDAGFGESLVGPLGAAAVRSRLAASDVFVLPSHWEGQPIAILEAMASGLAVVATTVGAVPDVIRDGREGLLVEPHDCDGLAAALRKVITDGDLRRRLGEAARARAAAHHDIANLRARLTAIYESELAA